METLGRVMELGGPVLGALLLLGALFGGFAFYRFLSAWSSLRAGKRDLSRGDRPLWEPARRLEEAFLQGGTPALDRALQAEGRRLRSGLSLAGALVAAAPLLGLLGTVDGMTRAFLALALAGGGADPARLGEGISRALVTTLAGLVVAIPGLLVHAGLAALAQAQENCLSALGNRLSLRGGPGGREGEKDGRPRRERKDRKRR